MGRLAQTLGLMNHPERSHHEQLERIDRLISLILAIDHHKASPGLNYYDLIIICIQSMWNLKDWILNDTEFGASSPAELKQEIFDSKCLLACSDLANGTKHFRLDRPKTNFSISGNMGLHVNASEVIFQQYIYILTEDHHDPYFGMEARAFVQECRATWQKIIDKHYLSNVYD